MYRHTDAYRHGLLLLVIGLVAWLAAGCASSQPYTLGPIKTEDPDRAPIPLPAETEENFYWDRVDLTFVYQLEKPLDLNWMGRQAGRALGVAEKRPPDNVNELGEVPNSSWFTRRIFYRDMAPGELARGPNTTGGPDTSRTITVTGGKFEGAGSGFVVRDARGIRYLIKLDGPYFQELASGAEAIATKIFWAAGYYVPENYITYFDPDRLVVGEGAEVDVDGERRPMTREDLEAMLAPIPRTADGRARALASKYIDGRPVGPWDFRGTRRDDLNDRVRHEHRRELRGMRVISAWLNDADRRMANTLSVYTDEQHLKHYLIDFGSTLGANGGSPHWPIHGQAYLIDPRYMALSTMALGLYEPPWARTERTMPFLSIGYFRADDYHPGRWVPTYPNPAFEKMTLEDAYWGAKIVMSFSDEDLEAIVETAQYSDPEAAAYLLRVLKERRDATGRYWFARINPLDRFRVEPASEQPTVASSAPAKGAQILRFDDLAVTSGLEPAEEASYAYRIYHGREFLAEGRADEPAVPLALSGGEGLATYLAREGATDPEDRVFRVELRTHRSAKGLSKATSVYVYAPPGEENALPRVVGIEREK